VSPSRFLLFSQSPPSTPFFDFSVFLHHYHLPSCSRQVSLGPLPWSPNWRCCLSFLRLVSICLAHPPADLIWQQTVLLRDLRPYINSLFLTREIQIPQNGIWAYNSSFSFHLFLSSSPSHKHHSSCILQAVHFGCLCIVLCLLPLSAHIPQTTLYLPYVISLPYSTCSQ
jgi:hypothetical protein